MIGRTLVRCPITAAIGAGGMGQVYRATDTNLGRGGDRERAKNSLREARDFYEKIGMPKHVERVLESAS